MNDKTAELRDIFVDVTDEETVTERQEAGRGTLTEDGASVEEIGEVIARMRERYEFSTSLTDEELATVVESFYSEAPDAAIADQLDVPEAEVFRARLDLHLLRESDLEAPFELDDLRKLQDAGLSADAIAEELGTSEEAVHRFRRVLAARDEARRASDRFRSEFEDLVADADLADQLTSDVKEDGLEEATDGMETDVSF